jgi:hypothetical protein
MDADWKMYIFTKHQNKNQLSVESATTKNCLSFAADGRTGDIGRINC